MWGGELCGDWENDAGWRHTVEKIQSASNSYSCCDTNGTSGLFPGPWEERNTLCLCCMSGMASQSCMCYSHVADPKPRGRSSAGVAWHHAIRVTEAMMVCTGSCFCLQPRRIRGRERHSEERRLQERKQDEQRPSPCGRANFVSWIDISCIKLMAHQRSPGGGPQQIMHSGGAWGRAWFRKVSGGTAASQAPSHQRASRPVRQGGLGTSPSLPFPPVRARLCQPGISHGHPHPVRSVGASCPLVLQGAPHIRWEATRVHRISSPSPKSRD